jgi:hypothetical protein
LTHRPPFLDGDTIRPRLVEKTIDIDAALDRVACPQLWVDMVTSGNSTKEKKENGDGVGPVLLNSQFLLFAFSRPHMSAQSCGHATQSHCLVYATTS